MHPKLFMTVLLLATITTIGISQENLSRPTTTRQAKRLSIKEMESLRAANLVGLKAEIKVPGTFISHSVTHRKTHATANSRPQKKLTHDSATGV